MCSAVSHFRVSIIYLTAVFCVTVNSFHYNRNTGSLSNTIQVINDNCWFYTFCKKPITSPKKLPISYIYTPDYLVLSAPTFSNYYNCTVRWHHKPTNLQSHFYSFRHKLVTRSNFTLHIRILYITIYYIFYTLEYFIKFYDLLPVGVTIYRYTVVSGLFTLHCSNDSCSPGSLLPIIHRWTFLDRPYS